MEITYTAKNRELTIQLHGELDHHAARGALARLEELTEQNLPRKLSLDFGGLTFMDSSGIAVVIRAKRRMEVSRSRISRVRLRGCWKRQVWTNI